MQVNNTNDEAPLLTIFGLTYNQKDYLAQCLEGIVMQKTKFRFRVIMHDDASTDGTTDILRQYAERYPEIVVPLIETENQFSKKGAAAILCSMFTHFKGSKYMAICEGDDYWTDADKLQRQVDFMEAHPDFALCYHNVMDMDMRTGEQRPYDYDGKDIPDETDINGLVGIGFYMRTCTTCYRMSALDIEQLQALPPVINLDIIMQHMAALHGRIKRLPEVMAVYRMGVGAWTNTDTRDIRHFAHMIKALTIIQTLMPNKELQLGIEAQIKWYIDTQEARDKMLLRYRDSIDQRLGKTLLWPLHKVKRLAKGK